MRLNWTVGLIQAMKHSKKKRMSVLDHMYVRGSKLGTTNTITEVNTKNHWNELTACLIDHSCRMKELCVSLAGCLMGR